MGGDSAYRQRQPGGHDLGRRACEVLGLNEESLWSGWQRDRNNPGARAHLEEVRRLIREERYGEAEAVAEAHMLGEYGESYLPLGSLRLAFKHGPATDYMRELDLEQATARVAYTAMARPTSGSIWPASRPGRYLSG